MNNRGIACHKNISVYKETYNMCNIKQLGVCTVRLRYKDKTEKYRFLVLPEDSPAWGTSMPDIQLSGILKIMFEVVTGQQAERKI